MQSTTRKNIHSLHSNFRPRHRSGTCCSQLKRFWKKLQGTMGASSGFSSYSPNSWVTHNLKNTSKNTFSPVHPVIPPFLSLPSPSSGVKRRPLHTVNEISKSTATSRTAIKSRILSNGQTSPLIGYTYPKVSQSVNLISILQKYNTLQRNSKYLINLETYNIAATKMFKET